MGKATTHTPGPFLHNILETALRNTRETHDPVTVFSTADFEFAVTLRKVGGKRVHSKAETLLMERIKAGQENLTAKERLMARRILARKP